MFSVVGMPRTRSFSPNSGDDRRDLIAPSSVATKGNRRVSGTRAGKRKKPRGAKGAKAKRPQTRSNSRRPTGSRRRKKPPVDPAERKLRNRILAMMSLLALINAYVFLWQGDGLFDAIGNPRSTAITAGHGPLGTFADPPEQTCGKQPVRMLGELHNLISLHNDLGEDRTLRLALLELGLSSAEIDAVEAAVRPTMDLGLLAGTGAPLRVAVDRHGTIQGLEVQMVEGHLLQVCREQGALKVRTLQHPASPEVATIALELGPEVDLFAAVEGAGEHPELAIRIAETLAFDLDVATEARPGDRIQLLVEKRLLGQQFHRYGHVLAIRYRGAAGRFAYYRYQPRGKPAAYYNAEGQPMTRTYRRTPVQFHRFPASARALMEPALEVIAGRVGVTFRQPEGAPIVALANGTVTTVGEQETGGLTVTLEHSDGMTSIYSHLSTTLGGIDRGSHVRAGDLIGLAGHTGQTPTDRVRIELAQQGEAATVDPLIIRAHGERRPPRLGSALDTERELPRFSETIAPWRKLLR